MNPSSVFVAREKELARLESFFDLCLQGKGQTVFVTGEAGSGKTALVTEFARIAQNKNPDLVVAYGQCNSLMGFGDPYLPFQEIFQQILGDVKGSKEQGSISDENASRLRNLFALTGQAVVDVGPELVGLFLPGAGLAAKLAAFAFDRSDWGKKLKQLAERKQRAGEAGSIDIDQKRIFEQYSNVLARLAEKVPLVLVLDDLHWTDVASSELLFHLSRRFVHGRLMLIGTYRPEEVALGRQSVITGQLERHPLEDCIHAVERYRADVFIPLGQEDVIAKRRFVDQFIDTEPNHLGEAFRQALFEHTDGHPLFTIELLRNLQERGDLVRDDQSRWVEGEFLNWEDFPARVEGVIEERIGRLSSELCEALQVGSVEGECFTAEVIARVLDANARKLVNQLSNELMGRHRLIEEKGTQQVKDLWLSIFQFNHNLIRIYVYNKMTTAQRRYLHQDVGNVLESLYGEQADSIALQLARHFEAAGMMNKASHYLYRAGVQAVERSANTEALESLSRGLELTPTEMRTERYELLLAREMVFDLRGEREVQIADLKALQVLAESMQDERKLARVYIRLSDFYLKTGSYDTAFKAAQQGIELAQKSGDVVQEAAGHITCGQILSQKADYEGAQTHLEGGLALIDSRLQTASDHQTSLAAEEVFDLRLLKAKGLRLLAIVISQRGNKAQAVVALQQARQLFQQLADRRGEGRTLNNLACVMQDQGLYEEARQHFEEGLSMMKVIGDRYFEGVFLLNLGSLAFERGQLKEASLYYQEGLQIKREIDDRYGQAVSLGNLGSVYSRQNDHTSSRRYYLEALQVFQEMGDRRGQAMMIENLAETCLFLGDYPNAFAYINQAKSISEEIDLPESLALCENLMSSLYYLTGDYEQSLTYCRRAIELAEKHGNFLTRLNATLRQASALEALQDHRGASESYHHTLEMLKEIGSEHEVSEPLAGLARIALAQGNPPQALEFVEMILPHLKVANFPYRAYLTCYLVLDAVGDPRAMHYLEEAHRLLMEHAASIPDEETRHSFLENIHLHREIVALWLEKHL